MTNLGVSPVPDLRATHRDRNPLEAMPDPDEPLPMRRPRNTGTTPAQVARELDRRLAFGEAETRDLARVITADFLEIEGVRR
jgi:hypothetical protein